MTLVNHRTIKTIHNHLQYNVQALCYLGMGYYLGRRYQQILPFTLAGGITAAMIYQARKQGHFCITPKTIVIVAKCIAAASAFYLCREWMGGRYSYKAFCQCLYEFGITVGFSIIDRIFYSYLQLPYLEKIAKEGDLEAQLTLAKVYDDEHDCWEPVQQDLKKSVQYYQWAADNGDVSAQNIIGMRYYEGEGVTQDFKQAFIYFKKAADQGNVCAHWNVGQCYFNGKGVEKDEEKAFSYHKKAADGGHIKAQNVTGMGYYNGDGVIQDFKQAFIYFKKAADLGNVHAQYNVGVCYFEAKGTEQNSEKALEYWGLGREQGCNSCRQKLEEISH